MSRLFEKPSAVDRQLKKIREELSTVDSSLRTLSQKPASAGPRPLSARVLQDGAAGGEGLPKPPPARGIAVGGAKPGVDTRSERFAEYLAKNFRAERPLARERNVQRNKAIVLAVFVLVLLAMLLYRLLAW